MSSRREFTVTEALTVWCLPEYSQVADTCSHTGALIHATVWYSRVADTHLHRGTCNLVFTRSRRRLHTGCCSLMSWVGSPWFLQRYLQSNVHEQQVLFLHRGTCSLMFTSDRHWFHTEALAVSYSSIADEQMFAGCYSCEFAFRHLQFIVLLFTSSWHSCGTEALDFTQRCLQLDAHVHRGAWSLWFTRNRCTRQLHTEAL